MRTWPNSLIPLHSKGELLWWFNVTDNKTHLGFQVKCLIFLPHFNQIWISQQIFVKVPSIKFQGTLSSWGCTDTCRQLDVPDKVNRRFLQSSKHACIRTLPTLLHTLQKMYLWSLGKQRGGRKIEGVNWTDKRILYSRQLMQKNCVRKPWFPKSSCTKNVLMFEGNNNSFTPNHQQKATMRSRNCWSSLHISYLLTNDFKITAKICCLHLSC